MKNIFKFLSVLFCFTACQKNIELDLDDSFNRIVIEANITDQPGPYLVKISKTVSIDQSSIFPAVSNAKVIIKDSQGNIDSLSHIGNGVYQTKTTQGVSGRQYFITVDVEGTIYTSQTQMPIKVSLDGLYHRLIEFGVNDQNTVTPIFTDLQELGNSYRFIITVNDTLDKSIIVANDAVNNGKKNDRPLFSNDIEIKSGDIVDVEMQCIDKQAYLYYFTLASIDGNGPGGGTTPSNPPNGFSNGALGLFSAYTTQVERILIP